ncbi:MAG TPA: C13 family peptidase [Cellvibrio sp.]|nr:C13 family peptidase [Cellvibrio sp.]
MKTIITHLLSLLLGVALVFSMGFYSLQDIGLVFSESRQFANGSTYKGNLDEHGRLSGYGRMSWSNGDHYAGHFYQGLFEGEGELTSADAIYKGQFHQGYMQGRGVLDYGGGAHYEGEFAQNMFAGKGILTNADGSIYEGDFESNNMTGKGKWILADKSVYTGDVKNGVYQGKGEWSRAGQFIYTGDFVDGNMHGMGVYKLDRGAVYSGEFKKGSFSGKGIFKSERGDTFEGEFLDWYLHGEGIKTNTTGNQWKGNFEYGQLNGQGSYTGKDGEQYTGEFEDGRYSGKGKLHEKNGDIYDGEFDYGEKDGKGLLIYHKPIDGISQVQGVWRNDRLVEGDKNVKIYSPAEISDYAIYHQQLALTQALAAVQPSDPKKPELYSLVIAAYGTEEVFRRESNFIKNLFSTEYGNRATALYLTNSQRSLDESPLATLTGIKQSIERIAAQMDKEKDIFFFYITSHGSEDRTISLTHNGLGLGDIDSKWLGDILKATGIQHKVIVLNACYSGGFIDDLKDSHSIIITAAAHDRKSFGCADDSDFTYFAKAYFKEALASNSNFVDAFYIAKKRVGEWEQDGKQKESNPQIYTVPGVEDYVKNWNLVRAK